MIQPISALDDVMPCIASVYSKSAPIKKACSPFSAPEITGIINEKQTANDGHKYDREEVEFATFFCIIHDNSD